MNNNAKEGYIMKIKLISSLEKCFLDDNIDLKEEYNAASCLKEGLFRFGVCYCSDEKLSTAIPIRLTVNSEISAHIN